MENLIEKRFIDNFIKKNKRERVLYELSNPRKRKDAIGRFCHNTLEMIDEKKIIYCGKHITIEELKKFINDSSKGEMCYVISWDEEFDGKSVKPSVALEHMISSGMAVVIIFTRLIIIKEEQEVGAPIKYVLFSDSIVHIGTAFID